LTPKDLAPIELERKPSVVAENKVKDIKELHDKVRQKILKSTSSC